MKTFSILITTKDRLNDLKITINSLSNLIRRKDVECVVCDDGSADDTFNYIKNEFPDGK